MMINQIKPTGPHIEGVIRFASEGQGDALRQLDHFEVLGRVHTQPQEGSLPALVDHPITGRLLPSQTNDGETRAIRVIPIRLIADKPENSLRARYEAYDAELGRLVCVGNGANGERAELSRGTSSNCSCPGPEACEFANAQGIECSLHVRLRLQIEGQEDPFSVFELQSGGINTYRTLAAKLEMMHKAFGGKLRGLPLELSIYAKSSVASSYQAFYVADLKLRSNMKPAEALKTMTAAREAEETAGLDFTAVEGAIAAMEANSALSLLDAESSIVTFSPVLVDRSNLRRAKGVVIEAQKQVVAHDIAQLVSQALQVRNEAASEVGMNSASSGIAAQDVGQGASAPCPAKAPAVAAKCDVREAPALAL